jgi:hypothetical protein
MVADMSCADVQTPLAPVTSLPVPGSVAQMTVTPAIALHFDLQLQPLVLEELFRNDRAVQS